MLGMTAPTPKRVIVSKLCEEGLLELKENFFYSFLINYQGVFSCQINLIRFCRFVKHINYGRII